MYRTIPLPLFIGILVVQCARFAAGDIQDAYNATVRVYAGGVGTGCVFAKDAQTAYIVTNNHVVEGSQSVTVEPWAHGRMLPRRTATVLHESTSPDIAILSCDASGIVASIPFAPASYTPPGGTILSIGCSNGHWPSGFVGHLVDSQDNDAWFLPVVLEGRSGSALFDSGGNYIVGVVYARSHREANQSTHSFAIPHTRVLATVTRHNLQAPDT